MFIIHLQFRCDFHLVLLVCVCVWHSKGLHESKAVASIRGSVGRSAWRASAAVTTTTSFIGFIGFIAVSLRFLSFYYMLVCHSKGLHESKVAASIRGLVSGSDALPPRQRHCGLRRRRLSRSSGGPSDARRYAPRRSRQHLVPRSGQLFAADRFGQHRFPR